MNALSGGGPFSKYTTSPLQFEEGEDCFRTQWAISKVEMAWQQGLTGKPSTSWLAGSRERKEEPGREVHTLSDCGGLINDRHEWDYPAELSEWFWGGSPTWEILREWYKRINRKDSIMLISQERLCLSWFSWSEPSCSHWRRRSGLDLKQGLPTSPQLAGTDLHSSGTDILASNTDLWAFLVQMLDNRLPWSIAVDSRTLAGLRENIAIGGVPQFKPPVHG